MQSDTNNVSILPSIFDNSYIKKNISTSIMLPKLNFKIEMSFTQELHNFKRLLFNCIDANKLIEKLETVNMAYFKSVLDQELCAVVEVFKLSRETIK